MAANTRPTTCGDLYVTSPELGSKGCKRLPRHGGEHRAHLTRRGEAKAERAKVAKVAAPKGRKAATGRKATIAEIKAVVKAARVTVGQPAGRLSAATKRQVVAAIMARYAAGEVSTSAALGAVASLA